MHFNKNLNENMLLVSDLHLGDSSKNTTRTQYMKLANQVDKEFCCFLDYWSKKPLHNQPWHLAIVGDFIDFDQLTFKPNLNQGRGLNFSITSREKEWGLQRDAIRSSWMLETIFERHFNLFSSLVRFIAKGNKLTVLLGNHDLALYWPKVKETFKKLMLKLYLEQRSQIKGDFHLDEKTFLNKISILDWFLYYPGEFWIEHGSQFDNLSGVQYVLKPLNPVKQTLLEENVSTLGIKYFSNKIPGLSVHKIDYWLLPDFFKWFVKIGLKATLKVGKGYFDLLFQSFKYWFFFSRHENVFFSKEQKKLLTKLEKKYNFKPKTLNRLVKLHKRPASKNLYKLANAFVADRFFLFILVIIIIPGLFFYWKSSLIFTLFFFSLFIIFWLLKKAKATENYHTIPKLRKQARKAHKITKTPIILGHSHFPMLYFKNSKYPYYYNIGSWLPGNLGKHKNGECDCSFSYIKIDRSKTPVEISLERWCGVNHKPNGDYLMNFSKPDFVLD